MYKKIYKYIKEYNEIVIARHIGADPDAICSSFALRESINLTFPKKKVYAVGSGSARFAYFGKHDRLDSPSKNSLLIVLDTPDKRRVDGIDLNNFKEVIKIDHHPFIDKIGNLELINENSSSASQLVLELINNTKLKMNEKIAELLFLGIVSDTNRFMFNNSKASTFMLVANLIKKYKFDVNKIQQPLYMRPISEVRLSGYIASNLKVTENGVGYIVITDEILNKYGVDAASPGNMINNYNFIEEILVWIFITEDVKNENIRVSVRSRGPEINAIAEQYNGGGHKYASGARLKSLGEVDSLIADFEKACKKYRGDINENR